MSRKKRRRGSHARGKSAKRAAQKAARSGEASSVVTAETGDAGSTAADHASSAAKAEASASSGPTTRASDEPSPVPAQASSAQDERRSAVAEPPARTRPAEPMDDGAAKETTSHGPAPIHRPHPGPVPRSMKVALYASVGAAVVSASLALFLVLRDDAAAEPSSLVRTAAAATVVDESSSSPAVPSAVPVPTPATIAQPPAAALGWPDLELGPLPPTGAAPPELGQSIGSPRDGALLAPVRMPNGRDYVLRDEHTVWGTSNTVEHLRAAITGTRRQHPGMHRVVIGDISARRGGPLPGHTSHQSGRDVDVGLVLRGRPEDAPAEFIEATRDNLDRRITFDLIAELSKTRDDPTGVDLIVLDYGLQRLLRRSAAARGVPEDELEALFRFPHGPTSRHGLVRHKPAHRDHMHVRFKCPEDDRYCRDPLIGFAGMEASEPSG